MPDNLILNQQRNKIYEKKQSGQPLSRHKLSRKKYDFIKKCLKSNLKNNQQQLQLQLQGKVCTAQEKISGVATKPTIFVLKPPEPKKIFFLFLKNLSSPP